MKIKTSAILTIFLLIGFWKALSAQTLEKSEILEAARQDVSVLASADFWGRGYQNDGHLLAAAFIENRFKKLGLKPIPGKENDTHPYFQSFGFSVNLIDSAELKINGKSLVPGEAYIMHPASGGTFVKGKIADAGYGLSQDYKNSYGYSVVIHEGLPKKFEKNEALKKKYEAFKDDNQKIGVAANLNCTAALLVKKKLTGGFSSMPFEIPVALVKEEFFPKNAKTIELEVFRRFAKVQSQNVMGWIEGSQYPDSFIFVTAHYDHLGKQGKAIFYGANDNASGTSMMLSMAEHYSQKGNRPKCSMVFVGFGAEEAGLIGSKYYVEKDPIFSLASIRFLLNLDLMGNGDQGMTAVAGDVFPEILELLRTENTRLESVPTITSRGNAGNSDHYYFVKNNVRGFFIYTLGGPPHYHDVYDTEANLLMSRYFEVRQLLIAFLDKVSGW